MDGPQTYRTTTVQSSSPVTPRLDRCWLLTRLFPRGDGSLHTIVLTFILLVVVCTSQWSYSRGFPGLDFYQFWIVPTAMREGEAVDRYAEPAVRQALGEKYFQRFRQDPPDRAAIVSTYRRNLETVGTPFLYTVFAAFAGNDYDFDFRHYQVLSTVALILATFVLCLLLGYTWLGAAVLLTLFCSAWEPMLSELRVANVNRVLVFILCICAILRHPRCSPLARRAAGVLLGLSIMFKPVFVGSVVFLLWLSVLRRRWREGILDALCVGAGIALALGASSAFFESWGVWPMWFREFSAMDDSLIAAELGNYSPSLALAQWTGLSRTTAGCGFGLIVFALFTAAWWRTSARDEEPHELYLAEIGAILGGGILFFFFTSKLVWLHYPVLLIPLYALLLRPHDQFSWHAATRFACTGVSAMLLGFVTWQVWLGAAPVATKQIVVVVGLTLLLIATVMHELKRSSAGREVRSS